MLIRVVGFGHSRSSFAARKPRNSETPKRVILYEDYIDKATCTRSMQPEINELLDLLTRNGHEGCMGARVVIYSCGQVPGSFWFKSSDKL